MPEIEEKHKINVIITVVLSIAILANIGIDIYIYTQYKFINSKISGIQVKEANIQKEYKSLLHKISDGKKNLSAIQK